MPPREAVAVGSAVVDHIYTLSNLPEPDGGAFAHDHTTDIGGVAANVASGLASLGTDTGLITRVGSDAASPIEPILRGRGLDCARLRTGSEESSYTLVLRNPAGERMIVAGGWSVPNLRIDERDIEYLRDCRVVFTSAYAPDAVVSELVSARERGAISMLVFDLAGPQSELEGRGTERETIDRLLPIVDLFVVGEVAAKSYFHSGFDDIVATLAQHEVSRAALTRGRDGAVLVSGDTVTEIPAFDVEVEDTTGAGDAFTAGLIHTWLLDTCSPKRAGHFAAAAAALNCTATGACGKLPTESEVHAFLDAQ